MIGVIVPAHNEAALIGACLRSIWMSAKCPRLAGEEVKLFVALDRCTDGTEEAVRAVGAELLIADGNVGVARAAAAAAAIRAGARWIASTDADTRVPVDWLSGQIAPGADAFCGVVTVDDWEDYTPQVQAAFHAGERRTEGHRHVHAANLGVDAEWYVRCGGFPAMPAHEDVALVEALQSAKACIARLPRPAVITSARRVPRARDGFGDYLLQLDKSCSCLSTVQKLAS